MLKDKNGKDLSEAEEIKKRWQEYTRELYKKGLNDPKGFMKGCYDSLRDEGDGLLHALRLR